MGIRLAAALIVVGQVTACGPVPSTPSGAPAQPLAERHTWGGLCTEGPCLSTLTIADDGSWSWSDEATGARGLISPREVALLRESIASSALRGSAGSDASAGAQPPSQDVRCDAHLDGQSVRYGWASPARGWQVVDSCQEALDPRDPLVTHLEQLAQQLAP